MPVAAEWSIQFQGHGTIEKDLLEWLQKYSNGSQGLFVFETASSIHFQIFHSGRHYWAHLAIRLPDAHYSRCLHHHRYSHQSSHPWPGTSWATGYKLARPISGTPSSKSPNPQLHITFSTSLWTWVFCAPVMGCCCWRLAFYMSAFSFQLVHIQGDANWLPSENLKPCYGPCKTYSPTYLDMSKEKCV